MYVWLLIPVILVVNYVIWKRRGRGWRQHVDSFIAVLQPYVPEPVVDVIVLEPAGFVGRQARAEQGRGLRTIFGGMGGEVSGAIAEHRASEDADREEVLPPWTALALTASRRYLLPVELTAGAYTAGPVERSWDVGEATYATSGRALTIQVTITLRSWVGEYELVRDPAKHGESVLARLAATG